MHRTTTPQWKWPRVHTKSRKGCSRCKLRKVKCDERRPSCQNCDRIGTACSYDVIQTLELSEEEVITNASPSPLMSRPVRANDDDFDTRMLDLRLLHDYITSVCSIFPFANDEQIDHFWTISVPQMSFNHEFLLDALLGTTALQMAARQPNDSQLVHAGYRYYGGAVTKQRTALATIDTRTAEPLCVTSILIMLMTLKIFCQRPLNEPYSPPSGWFRIVKGMGCLIQYCAAFLDGSGISLLMQKAHRQQNDLQSLSQLPDLPDLNKLFDDSTNFDNGLDDKCKYIRRGFYQSLRRCFAAAASGVSRHEVRYRLLGLVAGGDELFLQLTEQNDMLTVIILSHYFALLRWTGGNWWLQSDLDSELHRLSDSIPRQHQWAVVV